MPWRIYQSPHFLNQEVGFFVFIAADRKGNNRGVNGPTSAVVGQVWRSVEGLLVKAIGR